MYKPRFSGNLMQRLRDAGWSGSRLRPPGRRRYTNKGRTSAQLRLVTEVAVGTMKIAIWIIFTQTMLNSVQYTLTDRLYDSPFGTGIWASF